MDLHCENYLASLYLFPDKKDTGRGSHLYQYRGPSLGQPAALHNLPRSVQLVCPVRDPVGCLGVLVCSARCVVPGGEENVGWLCGKHSKAVLALLIPEWCLVQTGLSLELWSLFLLPSVSLQTLHTEHLTDLSLQRANFCLTASAFHYLVWSGHGMGLWFFPLLLFFMFSESESQGQLVALVPATYYIQPSLTFVVPTGFHSKKASHLGCLDSIPWRAVPSAMLCLRSLIHQGKDHL